MKRTSVIMWMFVLVSSDDQKKTERQSGPTFFCSFQPNETMWSNFDPPLWCSSVFTRKKWQLPIAVAQWQFVNTRAVDPDPHGSALISPPGSGSACNMRIRIRGGKFWGKKQKKCKEINNNCTFIFKNEVNMDQLHCF